MLETLQTPRHDVTIYAPYAGGHYDAACRRTGGAERQTVLLARSLTDQGFKVAHVVYPMREPVPPPGGPALVVRRPARYKPLGRAVDPLRIWRAMAAAPASVYVFRGASGVVGAGAAFCRARGGALVFSGANDADFEIPPMGMVGVRAELYLRGVRAAAAIVVQSQRQAGRAVALFGGVDVQEIPSFVELAPPSRAPGSFFLWAGRLVDYKRPEAFLALARALPEARFVMVGTISVGETAADAVAALRREAAGLPNVELRDWLPHDALMELVDRSVAVVNTSRTEGMPNVWLEGWARGVPALSLEFDPDGRIAREGLGIVAEAQMDALVAGASRLWEQRADRGGYGEVVRRYVEGTHSPTSVGARWAEVLSRAAWSGGRAPSARRPRPSA